MAVTNNGNTGTGKDNPFYVEITILDKDAMPFWGETKDQDNVKAGQTVDITFGPSDPFPEGEYTIQVTTDSTNAIPETNEINNDCEREGRTCYHEVSSGCGIDNDCRQTTARYFVDLCARQNDTVVKKVKFCIFSNSHTTPKKPQSIVFGA